jgi:iron complex outermembrane receptor protein
MNSMKSVGGASRRNLLKQYLTAGTILGGAALLFAAQSASAQTVAANAPVGTLTEVVVTAEKVEGNVQKTPIAIDVYGGQQLQSQGVHDINGLMNIAPAVNVTGNTGGGTVVTIRGISSRDTTEVGDPAVAISSDGFYVDRSYAIGLTQYDMDRIEVLKGPQGTLYGRNATGGAINIITTKPKKDYEGYVSVEAGNYNTLNTEGAVNVPFGDKVQARASFTTNFHDGYRDNGPNGRFDDANARSGRLQLSVQPTDTFRFHVLAQQTTQRSNPGGSFITEYVPDANGFVKNTIPTNLPNPKAFVNPAPGHVFLTDNAYRWDANFDGLPFGNLVYLGGYDDLKWDQLTPSWLYGPINSPPTQTRQYNQTEHPKTWNQELRIASKDPNGRFTYQAGLFYFQDDNALDSFNRQTNGLGVTHFIYNVKFKSLSEFASFGFKPIESLKLTLGVRNNHDEKTRVGTIASFSATGVPNPVASGNAGTRADKVTYHAGADWQWTSRNLVYAKYDTGYKAAGFTDIAPYGPETVTAYEIGTKNRFFDNKLQLNADYFSDDYVGQQVQQIVSGGGGLKIVNAGKSKIWGVEADILTISPIGRLDVNLAYLHARFTDFALVYNAPQVTVVGGVQTWGLTGNKNVQLAGNTPPQAPDWTIGVSWSKDFDVPTGRLTPQVQAKYTSKQNFSFFDRPDDTQKAYAITNFNLVYAPDGAKWEAQLFVRNLADTKAFSNAGENDRNFAYNYSWVAPRTYGVRFTSRW